MTEAASQRHHRLSPEVLVAALGGRWAGHRGSAPCPVPGHGKGRGDRRFSLSVGVSGDGKTLVHCHAGCSQDAVIDALTARGLWPERQRLRTRAAHHTRRRDRTRHTRDRRQRPLHAGRDRCDRALRAVASVARVTHVGDGQPPARERQELSTDRDAVWRAAWRDAAPLVAPNGLSPAARYLVETRRVVTTAHLNADGEDGRLPAPHDLAFHPNVTLSPGRRPAGPALVALMRDGAGAPCGIQATLLHHDARGAWVKRPSSGQGRAARFSLGRVDGGAVRLWTLQAGDLTGALSVAEGVETALGFAMLSGYPAWAALGANLAKVAIPPAVEELVIAADHDGPGLAYAQTLAAREAHERFVEVRHPEREGEDWADVANARWVAGTHGQAT